MGKDVRTIVFAEGRPGNFKILSVPILEPATPLPSASSLETTEEAARHVRDARRSSVGALTGRGFRADQRQSIRNDGASRELSLRAWKPEKPGAKQKGSRGPVPSRGAALCLRTRTPMSREYTARYAATRSSIRFWGA